MVFRKLNSSAAVIEEMTGVRIVRVVMKLCADIDCPLHFCDEVVSLDKSSMSTTRPGTNAPTRLLCRF